MYTLQRRPCILYNAALHEDIYLSILLYYTMEVHAYRDNLVFKRFFPLDCLRCCISLICKGVSSRFAQVLSSTMTRGSAREYTYDVTRHRRNYRVKKKRAMQPVETEQKEAKVPVRSKLKTCLLNSTVKGSLPPTQPYG